MPPFPPMPDGVEIRHCYESPGYAVTNTGAVYSCRKRGKRTGLAEEWRELQQIRISRGYMVVSFCIGDKKRQRRVHQLVLEAFVGPRPSPEHEVCHNNQARHDNRLENLRWGTSKENAADRYLHGTQPRGENSHRAKLTWDAVQQIRQLIPIYSLAKIAREYGVRSITIARIRDNKNWVSA